jgi:hypothetical protein
MSGHLANSIDNPYGREYGAATLTITLILLFALSLITFYSARVGIVEQKISANEYRAKQAFEAAQAGLEIGTAYLNNRIIRKQITTDTDNDGLIDPYQTDLTSGLLTNNAGYMINYSNNAWPNDFRLIQLDSTGWSDDKSASANIRQTLQLIPLLLNPPDAGVTGRGDIIMDGNINLINTETNITARGGGSVTLQGGSQATTSDPGNNGIEENDPDLLGMNTDEEFFQSFFGATRSDAGLQSINLTCDESECVDQNDQSIHPGDYPGENLWITGNTTIDSNIGAADHPVILIVDGDLNLEGDISIWGLIYFTSTGHTIHSAGNAHLHGVLVAENDSFLADGDLTIEYDAGVILPPRGGNGLYVRVAGTWRDF